ncbi:MAG: hypothetical protein JXR48_12405 [Candidatus Delongbacteria bacterium]|nr:hypothetical protein [Candidatus Delongbacteria bacterium]MBN2835754.1 hypothetical protein [Candidatus Delongbacteria bacterium]
MKYFILFFLLNTAISFAQFSSNVKYVEDVEKAKNSIEIDLKGSQSKADWNTFFEDDSLRSLKAEGAFDALDIGTEIKYFFNLDDFKNHLYAGVHFYAKDSSIKVQGEDSVKYFDFSSKVGISTVYGGFDVYHENYNIGTNSHVKYCYYDGYNDDLNGLIVSPGLYMRYEFDSFNLEPSFSYKVFNDDMKYILKEARAFYCEDEFNLSLKFSSEIDNKINYDFLASYHQLTDLGLDNDYYISVGGVVYYKLMSAVTSSISVDYNIAENIEEMSIHSLGYGFKLENRVVENLLFFLDFNYKMRSSQMSFDYLLEKRLKQDNFTIKDEAEVNNITSFKIGLKYEM